MFFSCLGWLFLGSIHTRRTNRRTDRRSMYCVCICICMCVCMLCVYVMCVCMLYVCVCVSRPSPVPLCPCLVVIISEVPFSLLCQTAPLSFCFFSFFPPTLLSTRSLAFLSRSLCSCCCSCYQHPRSPSYPLSLNPYSLLWLVPDSSFSVSLSV